MRSPMSDRSRQRLRTILTILVTALIIAPAAALATHGFSDVNDSDFYHAAVDWMKANDVTAGCNPPDNTRYCPDDPVTRGEMAVFFERLDSENVFVRPGDDAVDGGNADMVDGMHAADFLGATDKAVDSDLLDGVNGAEYATDTEVATALGDLDAFIPIAVFTVTDAATLGINNVSFRDPITGTPTVSGSDGVFLIDLPGFDFERLGSNPDTAVCTALIRDYEVVVDSSGGDLEVTLYDQSGALETDTDDDFNCAVYAGS